MEQPTNVQHTAESRNRNISMCMTISSLYKLRKVPILKFLRLKAPRVCRCLCWWSGMLPLVLQIQAAELHLHNDILISQLRIITNEDKKLRTFPNDCHLKWLGGQMFPIRRHPSPLKKRVVLGSFAWVRNDGLEYSFCKELNHQKKLPTLLSDYLLLEWCTMNFWWLHIDVLWMSTAFRKNADLEFLIYWFTEKSAPNIYFMCKINNK